MQRGALFALLIVMGAGWGLTEPLSKIAVSTGHRPLGLIFWQEVIGVLVLGALCLLTGRRLWPRDRFAWGMAVFIAFAGTILPNAASYAAVRELPAGVMAIVISLTPIMAYPLALMLRNERFAVLRLGGLCLGFAGVLLLLLPEASLPGRASTAFVLLALVAPFFYALEGNVVGRLGLGSLDPVQALFAAAVIGGILTGPAAWASGVWIDPRAGIGAPELALAAAAVIHAAVYTAYVWMVGRAGAVFTQQVGYLVTAFGIGWSMLILSERYAGGVWAAALLIVAGMLLVQPRRKAALAAT